MKSRPLAKGHTAAGGIVNRGFLILTMLEAMGVAGVIVLAQRTGRQEMIPAWIGTVIGLHFFGLGKVFRAPVYYFTGGAMTLWRLLSVSLFRGDAMTVSAAAGSGAILWATSLFNVLRVRAMFNAMPGSPADVPVICTSGRRRSKKRRATPRLSQRAQDRAGRRTCRQGAAHAKRP